MAIDKLKPQLIDTSGASDGDGIVFSSANGVFEVGQVSSDSSASGNAHQVQSNADSFASYANTTFATDADLNVLQGNVDTFATYANTTFGSTTTIDTVSSNVDSVSYGLTGANTNIDTVSSNVDSVSYGLTGANTNIDTVSSNVESVSYGLTGANTNINLVQGNTDTFASYANTTFATDTNLDLVQGNADSFASYANSTFATVSGGSAATDEVQGNVDTFATYANSTFVSNTAINVGGTLLANDTINFLAGSGINLTTVAGRYEVTVSAVMNNATSQLIQVDGASNTFTLSKSVSNSNMVALNYGGLNLLPDEFTVTNNTTLSINNTAPLVSGTQLEIRYFDFFEGGGVSDAPVPATPSVTGDTQLFMATNVSQIYVTPFASDVNAAVWNPSILPTSMQLSGHAQSTTFGYILGGFNPSYRQQMEKFPFASATATTDVGSFGNPITRATSFSTTENGYQAGGTTAVSGPNSNTVWKFPFASDVNATLIAATVNQGYGDTGTQSSTHGYKSGSPFSPQADIIGKHTFASDADGTDAGELTQSVIFATGASSTTHGYLVGGYPPLTDNDTIQKFPFASDVGSSDIAEFTTHSPNGVYGAGGGQSSTHGYVAGGTHGSPPNLSVKVTKFPFSSDAPSTEVGNSGPASGGYGIGWSD